jgi:hypothetical protein
VLLVLLAAACDHDKDSAASSSATVVLPPLPPLPEMSEMPSPSGTATKPADGGTPCGAFGMPDCPLQGWMRKNMNPPMKSKDYQGLADSLERAAKLAPPDYAKAGYTNWVSIAQDGANAARAAELDAVKAACRGCHEQYKKKYRAEMRLRPIQEP